MLINNFAEALDIGVAYVGGADRKTILLKQINDAIRNEQSYLRVRWKEKQYD